MENPLHFSSCRFSPIKKAINQARKDKAKEAKEAHELAIKNRVNPVLDEWRKRDKPPTEEEIQEFSLEICDSLIT